MGSGAPHLPGVPARDHASCLLAAGLFVLVFCLLEIDLERNTDFRPPVHSLAGPVGALMGRTTAVVLGEDTNHGPRPGQPWL